MYPMAHRGPTTKAGPLKLAPSLRGNTRPKRACNQRDPVIHRSSGEHCGAGRGIFHFAKPTGNSGKFLFVPDERGMMGGATNDSPRAQPLRKDRTESGTTARHADQCGRVKDITMLGLDDPQGSGLPLLRPSVEMSHPGWPGWRNPPNGCEAFAAYVDCEKCYDHISLSDLAFQGCLQGSGRLVTLAAAQYVGQRYVRWAGALSRPVDPTHGIPAGCPLANGMLDLFLLRAMRNTTYQIQETKFCTYADDWKLFAQGMRRKAAQDIVGSFVTASDELRRTGMVVSLTKSVILASGSSARAALSPSRGRFRSASGGPHQGPRGRRHPHGCEEGPSPEEERR